MNPGVTAVVMFYLLAGHVVSHLWDNVLSDGKGLLWRFYQDRVLRIMPLYLYVTGLTLVFLMITDYGNPDYGVFRLLGNLLVVPVNYYMVLDTTILTDPSWALIPVAWSLGAELQAYVILPLILTSKYWKAGLIAGSLIIYILANAGSLPPDYFGYRLVCGVFFMFAAGSCIQRTGRRSTLPADRIEKWFPGCVWMAALAWLTAGWIWNAPLHGYAKETLLGLVLGIPLVVAGSRSRIRLPYNALLGSLSYGVFLSHFLVIWITACTGMPDRGSVWYIPVVTMGASTVAFVGVKFLETRVDQIRKYEKQLAISRENGNLFR